MDIEKAIQVLTDYNKWRLGEDGYEMQQPKDITIAIDLILEIVKKQNKQLKNIKK